MTTKVSETFETTTGITTIKRNKWPQRSTRVIISDNRQTTESSSNLTIMFSKFFEINTPTRRTATKKRNTWPKRTTKMLNNNTVNIR
jgi:hypothetical protein